MRTLRPVALVVVVACGVQWPARNDPADAKTFHCTLSDTKPERNTCTVDAASCSATVEDAKEVGAFMSPCHESRIAWCAVSKIPDLRERTFVCGPTREACGFRREEAIDNKNFTGTGECVERTAGQ